MGTTRRDRADQSNAASGPARPRRQCRLPRQTLHPILRRDAVESGRLRRNRASSSNRRPPTSTTRTLLSQRISQSAHPGQGRLRAVAPVDEPARRNQHPLPDGRRAAHRHRGQVEHDTPIVQLQKNGSRSGDDQPGFGRSDRDVRRAVKANRSFRQMLPTRSTPRRHSAISRLCPRASRRSAACWTSQPRQPDRTVADAQAFRNAAKAHQAYLQQAFTSVS